MKRFLILFAVLAMVYSCSNNEISEIVPPEGSTTISFRTLRDKAMTRYANDNEDTYMVYAQISGQSDWYFNTIVSPIEPTATDTLDNPASIYYWPGTQEVNFYAYCPAEETTESGVTGVTASISDEDASIKIDYTVPADANMDFTIATPITQKGAAKGSTNSPVVLKFGHMLTKVAVKAVLSETLTNNGYTLNTDYTVDFTVRYIAGSIDVTDTSAGWNLTAASESTTYTGNTGYIIMPQKYDADTDTCSLQLKGIVIKRGSGTFFSGALDTYILATTDIENATFLAGTQYNLYITITGTAENGQGDPIFNGDIQFSSSMANWGSDVIDVDQP